MEYSDWFVRGVCFWVFMFKGGDSNLEFLREFW